MVSIYHDKSHYDIIVGATIDATDAWRRTTFAAASLVLGSVHFVSALGITTSANTTATFFAVSTPLIISFTNAASQRLPRLAKFTLTNDERPRFVFAPPTASSITPCDESSLHLLDSACTCISAATATTTLSHAIHDNDE